MKTFLIFSTAALMLGGTTAAKVLTSKSKEIPAKHTSKSAPLPAHKIDRAKINEAIQRAVEDVKIRAAIAAAVADTLKKKEVCGCALGGVCTCKDCKCPGGKPVNVNKKPAKVNKNEPKKNNPPNKLITLKQLKKKARKENRSIVVWIKAEPRVSAMPKQLHIRVEKTFKGKKKGAVILVPCRKQFYWTSLRKPTLKRVKAKIKSIRTNCGSGRMMVPTMAFGGGGGCSS